MNHHPTSHHQPSHQLAGVSRHQFAGNPGDDRAPAPSEPAPRPTAGVDRATTATDSDRQERRAAGASRGNCAPEPLPRARVYTCALRAVNPAGEGPPRNSPHHRAHPQPDTTRHQPGNRPGHRPRGDRPRHRRGDISQGSAALTRLARHPEGERGTRS